MVTKADLQALVEQQAKEIQSLTALLARAQRELEGRLLPDELMPDGVTNSVKKWMLEYKLPWEIFWCADHHQWVDELGSSFPYDIYAECPVCRDRNSQ